MPHPLVPSRASSMRGFTLTELLVGVAVGILVLLIGTTLFSNTITSSSETINAAHLNQQLRATMEIMARDIRRTGFWSTPAPSSGMDCSVCVNDPTTNPFSDITMSSSCILFSYDLNTDGLQGVGTSGTPGTNQNTANQEQFGYRLNSGAVEIRKSGSPCNSGTWEDVTDASVNVTGLTFALDPAETVLMQVDGASPGTTLAFGSQCPTGVKCLLRRQVNVTLSGTLADDSSVSKTISQKVRLPNDLYCLGNGSTCPP